MAWMQTLESGRIGAPDVNLSGRTGGGSNPDWRNWTLVGSALAVRSVGDLLLGFLLRVVG